MKEIKKLK